MAKKQEVINDANVTVYETKEKIVQILNESKLPIVVLDYILGELHSVVHQQYEALVNKGLSMKGVKNESD